MIKSLNSMILLMLFIHCVLLLPLYVVWFCFCIGPVFCDMVFSALSSFAIILLRKRELVALL